MSWSDKIGESILYSFGKDPPEQRKKEIKKKIREELSKNPTLSNILRQNKAEGKFIKEFTNQLMKRTSNSRDIGDTINYIINRDPYPINTALCWCDTSQGHDYWSMLDSIVSANLRKTKF
jgi:hypothetical protein